MVYNLVYAESNDMHTIIGIQYLNILWDRYIVVTT